MPRKYISQQNNLDFFYPNYNKAEYDIEMVHDINNNCVSGSVINFSATTVSSTGITFSISDTWSLNGAKRWIRNSNSLAIYSIHMLVPGQDYFKPWRLVHSRSSVSTGSTTFSETNAVFIVTRTLAGVSGFTSGTYYFEVRFIGHDCTYNVCFSRNLTVTPVVTPTPTPSPTPTPTPTGSTPTPTVTPTPTPTPTEAESVLYVYAKYKDAIGSLQYSINGGSDVSLGTVNTTNCTFWATITGLTNGDSISFTSPITQVIAGSDSSPCPNSGFLCGYTKLITSSGANFVYLTIDGNDNC